MEDTLRGSGTLMRNLIVSLNPCFNGRYSQSPLLAGSMVNGGGDVLILVLMEDTLRER